jgi:hypothetical protein
MNIRKDPPRLQDLAYRKICKILREVGMRWTSKLNAAAVMGPNHWFQEIESVERECVAVRHKLASLPVPFVSEYVFRYAIREFTRIIEFYIIKIDRIIIKNLCDRQDNDDICANMFKAVLLPCMSTCNIGIAESEFVQELLIKLLYVIPNIKALILPPVRRPNYMRLFVERIQILTQLQEFRFRVGCTTEIIIELSKYCPHLIKLSVQYSRRVDDQCVEHLLKLKHIRHLNVAETSISNNSYRALLSGLPQLQDITWFDPIEPVLMGLKGCLPSVRKFVGKVSSAQLLVRKCPKISELVLNSLTEDISDLGELRSVAELSVLDCCCSAIGLSALITRLGGTLRNLKMHHDLNININDIINYCTVLNELTISFCHITCKGTFDRKLPHFQNLKKLRLKQNWGPFNFTSVLHLYVNMNVLHVVGMDELTDTVIEQIVTAGGFRNVTECIIDHCGEMGRETACLLMQNCPILTTLGNINCWPGVVNGEFTTLVNFVTKKNLSLTVCP